VFTARAATLSTVSVVAVSLGLAALTGASAAEQRGTTPDFRGPVLISGVCSGKAAFHGSVRQVGDRVVLTVQFHRAGERARWNLTTEATTYFGDGTAVTGIGDFGTAHSDADGKMKASVGTPLGVRHELKLQLSRPRAGEHCYIRVQA
jgi:hypothetical protein